MQTKGSFLRIFFLALVAMSVAAALAESLGSQDPQSAESPSLDLASAAEPDLPGKHEPITPIPPPPAADPQKVALGESLFEDRRLSRNQNIACVSCHDVRTSGANSQPRGPSFGRIGGSLNAPTVFNAALDFRLNWEGDVRSLEDQAALAFSDDRSLGQDIDADIRRLTKDPDMVRRFYAAYGHKPDRDSLLNAIATFERSLVTPDSPFDRWLRGDTNALSPQAVEGYGLFKSFGCVSCHQGANVGGNLFEESGIFHMLASPQPQVFRVPSLRNVAVTAPYFHDGSAPTLPDAVRRMGYAQLDRKLSDDQVDQIVAFLQSLTGVYHGKTLTPPP
jgi:cytochrome c peroxidase